jgi:hypothetical protein
MLQTSVGALEGSISGDAFYRELQEPHDESQLYRIVYEDLEEGVLHFPGKFWSKKPDWPAWKQSEMFRRIAVDEAVLQFADVEESKLVEVRGRLLDDSGLALEQQVNKARALIEEGRHQ